jgi:hypothetical protein
MDRIDFSNLGGFPLEQDTLDFMQLAYKGGLGAVAKLCGNKTIITGVEVTGSSVSDGWISYNGELILFQGGTVGAQVVISETPTQVTYEDGNIKEAYFLKTAKCGVIGSFPFSDLVPLLSLVNVWRPGDIKERYCDAAYIAANFDSDGYGLNAEKGWRILSKAYPDSAGKTFVNLDTSDDTFYQIGLTGGSKKEAISKDNLPAIQIDVPIPRDKTSSDNGGWGFVCVGDGPQDGGAGPTLKTAALGIGTPYSKLQPYFVILKLIKL